VSAAGEGRGRDVRERGGLEREGEGDEEGRKEGRKRTIVKNDCDTNLTTGFAAFRSSQVTTQATSTLLSKTLSTAARA
jgi:hypothetical protein